MLHNMRIFVLGLALFGCAGSALAAPFVHAHWQGPIGPATVQYFARALGEAEARKAPLVLELDTPGGLLTSTQAIVRRMMQAHVPVIVWVPPGARAASAGVFLLYAAHIAAAAPSAHLGAATPVALGAPSEGKGKKGPSTMEKKALNDAVAMIRALARTRGRNAKLGERMVREALAVDAVEAKQRGAIDILARDFSELLAKVSGRKVALPHAQLVVPRLRAADEVALTPSVRERLLAWLSRPTIAYLLLLLGFYGLAFEALHPGAIFPGVLGGIAFLLGLYGMSALPVDAAGAFLIVLGLALMIAEAFAPGFGVLGIGGAVAFVLGSLMLLPEKAPGFRLPLGVILGATAANFALLALALGALVRARRRRVQTGPEAEIGAIVEALEDMEKEGFVRHMGERWRAVAKAPLAKGARARVVDVRDDLVLVVEPLDSQGKGGEP